MIGHPDRGEYHSSTLTKRIFTYKNEKVKQHETDVTPSNSYQEMVEKETEIENLFHVRTDMKNSDKDQLFREETTVSEELIINAKAIGSNKEPDGQLSEPPSGTPSETPCGTLSGPLSVPLRGQPSGPPSGPPSAQPSRPPSGPKLGPTSRATSSSTSGQTSGSTSGPTSGLVVCVGCVVVYISDIFEQFLIKEIILQQYIFQVFVKKF